MSGELLRNDNIVGTFIRNGIILANRPRITEKVLWTNPSPTSARSGTNTITLSESYENYDYVKITFKYTNDAEPIPHENVKSVYISTEDLHVEKGPTVALSRINASGTYVASRYIYSNSYTTIKDVCVGSGNPTTTAIITEIIGLKEEHVGNETELWSNANPTSSFAETTLSDIEIGAYEYLKIVYTPSTTDTLQKNTIIQVSSFTTGSNGRYMIGGTASNGNWARLLVRESATSIRIADSRAYGGTTTSNDMMIPLKIYGLNRIEDDYIGGVKYDILPAVAFNNVAPTFTTKGRAKAVWVTFKRTSVSEMSCLTNVNPDTGEVVSNTVYRSRQGSAVIEDIGNSNPITITDNNISFQSPFSSSAITVICAYTYV